MAVEAPDHHIGDLGRVEEGRNGLNLANIAKNRRGLDRNNLHLPVFTVYIFRAKGTKLQYNAWYYFICATAWLSAIEGSECFIKGFYAIGWSKIRWNFI